MLLNPPTALRDRVPWTLQSIYPVRVAMHSVQFQKLSGWWDTPVAPLLSDRDIYCAPPERRAKAAGGKMQITQ